MSKILYITGGTGFVGSQLISSWLELDSENTVIVQSRQTKKSKIEFDKHKVRFVKSMDELESNLHLNAVVNLAGKPIADKRWTAITRRDLRSSRVDLSKGLLERMERKSIDCDVFISASAIGYYPHDKTATLDESGEKGDGFASDLCSDWENAIRQNIYSGINRKVLLRLGVVLGKGGMLEKLYPLYFLGLGGPIGSGQQGLSWIAREDLVALILEAVSDSTYSGTYNAVAPAPVSQSEFSNAYAKALGRKSWLRVPAFVFHLIFGQMARELLTGGQFVIPQRLTEKGFVFRFPRLSNYFEKNCSSP